MSTAFRRDRFRKSGQGDVVSDNETAIVIDAGNALGQLTAHQAVKLAVERAKELGMAIVAVRNAFHFGTAGRYARLIAEQDCVGIVMSNTRPLMPAPGGAEAMTGNNPIAIALPSAGEFPVEVDMAMSATAMGKIRLAAAAGQSIPSDWAMAADGKPTTDPAEAIKGMLAAGRRTQGFRACLRDRSALRRAVGRRHRRRSAPALWRSRPSPIAAASFSSRSDTGAFPDGAGFAERVNEQAAARHRLEARAGHRLASTRQANSRMRRALPMPGPAR